MQSYDASTNLTSSVRIIPMYNAGGIFWNRILRCVTFLFCRLFSTSPTRLQYHLIYLVPHVTDDFTCWFATWRVPVNPYSIHPCGPLLVSLHHGENFFQWLHLIVYPTKAICAWLTFIFQDYNASFSPWNLDRIYVWHEQLQGVCPRSFAFYWKSGSSRGILQDHWFVTVTLYFTIFQWLDHQPYWTVVFLLPQTNSCAHCKVLPLPPKLLS
jgi:hypothetical protein